MPAGFDKCRSNGGRIRTEQVGDGQYRHVCYLDGKRYPGYVKTRQSEGADQALKGGGKKKSSHNSSHSSHGRSGY